MELLGDALTSALQATSDPLIQVRDDRRLLGRVSRRDALRMIQSGDYIGVGSPKRVRHLRQIKVDERLFPLDSTFWDGRGVIRFFGDQASLARRRVKNTAHAMDEVRSLFSDAAGKARTAHGAGEIRTDDVLRQLRRLHQHALARKGL